MRASLRVGKTVLLQASESLAPGVRLLVWRSRNPFCFQSAMAASAHHTYSCTEYWQMERPCLLLLA